MPLRGVLISPRGLPALRFGCLVPEVRDSAQADFGRSGGWGGIACAALRLSRCARLELRSSSLREASSCLRQKWRMGRDWSREATCLTARTAFFIPPRGFKLPSAEVADGEGFEPSVHCCTHAFQACAFDHSATHPGARRIKHHARADCKAAASVCEVCCSGSDGRHGRWSASGGLPQFHEQEQGGDGGGKDEGEEEEVDEGVHARQSNTGGRTSAGGGRIILRLKAEFEV